MLTELVEAAQSLPDDEALHNSVVQVGCSLVIAPLPPTRTLISGAPPSPPALRAQMAMSIRPDAVKAAVAGASFAAPTPPTVRARVAEAQGERKGGTGALRGGALCGGVDHSRAVLMLGPSGHAAPHSALQSSKKAKSANSRMTLDSL